MKSIHLSWACLLYIIPLCVLAIYDPYSVTYDSESDYIANALHIIDHGFPYHSTHPGIVTQYIISIPLYLSLSFDINMVLAIHITRLFLSIIFMLLVTSSFKLLGIHDKKDCLLAYSIIILLIVIFPPTSVLFRYISSEILLFAFSFLSCAVWFSHLKNSSNWMIIALTVSLALNAKLTYILLLIPLCVFHLLYYDYNKKGLLGLILLSKILFYTVLFFLILSLPNYSQIISIVADLFGNWFEMLYRIFTDTKIYMVLFSSFVIFYLRRDIYNFCLNKKVLDKFILDGWVLVVPVMFFILYKVIYYIIHIEFDYLIGMDSWERIGILRRNSVPLYALVVFFVINWLFSDRISCFIKYKNLYSFIFILLSSVLIIFTANKDLTFESKKKLFDDALLNINNSDSHIYILRDNYFDSVVQFNMFTYIRYGNCLNYNKIINSRFAGDFQYDKLSYLSVDGQVLSCIQDETIYKTKRQYDYRKPNSFSQPICEDLKENKFKSKYFVLDKRYIDFDDYHVVVESINNELKKCGFTMGDFTRTVNNYILFFEIYNEHEK